MGKCLILKSFDIFYNILSLRYQISKIPERAGYQTLVKNRGALKTYKEIKNTGITIEDGGSDWVGVSSTTSHLGRVARSANKKKGETNVAGAPSIDWRTPL